MNEESSPLSHYLPGEEKFGFMSSRLYSLFSGMATGKYYEEIVEFVRKYKPARVLDVGSGPGDVMLRLSSALVGAEILGVDPSPSMVSITERRIARNNSGNRLAVGMGSSRDVPFPGRFDIIMTSFSFHHWKEQEKSIINLLPYLSEGGRIMIFELNSWAYPGKLPLVRKHAIDDRHPVLSSMKGINTERTTIAGQKIMVYVLTGTVADDDSSLR